MENNTSNQHTPIASVIGALIITAGLLTVLIALGEKMRTSLIAGAVLTVVGIIMVMIGKRQKNS